VELRIGQDELEHVVIDVQAGPDPEDEHGWVSCELTVKAGAWSGSYAAELRTPEFPLFREQLEQLRREPTAIAVFETLEGQLKLRLIGDRRGHIRVRGRAMDKAGIGNQLEFGLEIDQSYLPELIAKLKLIEKRFPARGSG